MTQIIAFWSYADVPCSYQKLSKAIKMFAQYLKLFAFLLAIQLIFLGCSKDDDKNEISCSFELVIKIIPEGSGTVEKEVLPQGDDWRPPMYKLTAIPYAGYSFKEWLYPDGTTRNDNTIYISCGTADYIGVETRTRTAVFEKME